ncbi:hypothetical protein SAMN02745218_01714 [Desulfofundulus australicus DSM 11792]|uniref:Uncharacterized protein n=2 Tax=Desulfofundulus TaxID=2282741 RepID=A0A1M4ZUR9_9FIRM|nr:hypothetical protein [Desulfofundulus australicus]SHF21721.1 hypothetical protein SAMN02745218_01714 [Desulfofundulus australicus DSM 11792]
MNQCPLAYVDPCSKCAQFGNCCPSQAVHKLIALEKELQDIKALLQELLKRQLQPPDKLQI